MRVHAKVEHKSHRHEFLAKAAAIASRSVVVGITAQKARRSKGGADNAMLGLVHEFGTSTVPARPWLRPAMAKHRAQHVKALAALYRSAKTEADVEQGLGRLGAMASAQVKNYITAGPSIPPPLAAETVRRKGSTRALVDTGAFVGSITWDVRRAAR